MAKIMQAECNQVCLNLLRQSLSYANLQIKSEKLTSLGGIFQTTEQFNILLGKTIIPRSACVAHPEAISTMRFSAL